LPESLSESIEWRWYGGLEVGFAGREPLIALKLFAAVDRDRRSVHYQDLVALEPSAEELNRAARWVKPQDTGASFSELVDQVVHSVLADLGRDR
jgi:hypothetical protein